MNEQGTGNGAQQRFQSELQRFVPTEITLIFRKFEGYILNGIGSRSVPVDKLAWLSDENVISFKFFKIPY